MSILEKTFSKSFKEEHFSFYKKVIATLKTWADTAIDQWDLSSTLLTVLIFALWIIGQIWWYDSDLHPLQLGRQSSRGEIRMPKKSAVYRAAALGFNGLTRGLDVVDAGAKKFSKGRDGDLRDVWRRFVKGDDKGKKSVISTVLGTKVEAHDTDSLTSQIALIGEHISKNGGFRVAIFLPNSVEFILSIFACSFQPNLTIILIPNDASPADLMAMLKVSAADTLIAYPGTFPFDTVKESYPNLRQVIWVVDHGTSNMDWNSPPTNAEAVSVSIWSDIVKRATDIPELTEDTKEIPGDLVFFWKPDTFSQFTQQHVISAMAAQIASIPSGETMTPKDTFVPADLLSNQYTLILTLVALFSNANIALNSVSGMDASLTLATANVPVTIISATPEQALLYHSEGAHTLKSSFLLRQVHAYRQRLLENYGVFPKTEGLLANLEKAGAPTIGDSKAVPRAVYIAERCDGKPVLSQKVLSDIRAFTGARVVHALIGHNVAGAVAQSLWYDYRVHEDKMGHFGPPGPSVELWLSDKGEAKTTDFKIQGEINVRGPSVVGDVVNTGALGSVGADVTISLL